MDEKTTSSGEIGHEVDDVNSDLTSSWNNEQIKGQISFSQKQKNFNSSRCLYLLPTIFSPPNILLVSFVHPHLVVTPFRFLVLIIPLMSCAAFRGSSRTNGALRNGRDIVRKSRKDYENVNEENKEPLGYGNEHTNRMEIRGLFLVLATRVTFWHSLDESHQKANRKRQSNFKTQKKYA